jgi:pyruvate/2-oxoglutarate dehydrogenase complex dihydrolipoamide acyltransferase (E2) component
MIVDYLLPEVGDDVQEATIVEWHKEIGDNIEEGDVLLEVMTEKVNTEIECSVSGTLVEILYPKETEVKVGDIIAKIEEIH